MALELNYHEIILFFLFNPKILAVLAGLIAEEVVLLLMIFSGKGSIAPFQIIFLFGFLGVMAIDCVYYFIGRCKFVEKLRKIKFVSKSYERLPEFMTGLKDKNEFIFLCLTKYVYGIRILGILSL